MTDTEQEWKPRELDAKVKSVWSTCAECKDSEETISKFISGMRSSTSGLKTELCDVLATKSFQDVILPSSAGQGIVEKIFEEHAGSQCPKEWIDFARNGGTIIVLSPPCGVTRVLKKTFPHLSTFAPNKLTDPQPYTLYLGLITEPGMLSTLSSTCLILLAEGSLGYFRKNGRSLNKKKEQVERDFQDHKALEAVETLSSMPKASDSNACSTTSKTESPLSQTASAMEVDSPDPRETSAQPAQLRKPISGRIKKPSAAFSQLYATTLIGRGKAAGPEKAASTGANKPANEAWVKPLVENAGPEDE